MLKKFLLYKILIITVILFAGCSSSSNPKTEQEEITVVFFYTNDVHGQVLPYTAHRMEGQPKIGGVQALEYYLKQETEKLEEQNIPYFIFDAGDFFQGTPESNLTKGKIMVEALNHLNYDLISLGNHEFDWGFEILQNLIETSNAKYLSANLIQKKGNYLDKVEPYTILKRGNTRIGVIGIITQGLFDYSAGDLNNYIDVLKYTEVLPKYIKKLQDENVDLIVLLSHVSTSDNLEYAQKIRNIDIVFGGHNHVGLPESILTPKTRTIICQNAAKLETLGMLKVTYQKPANKIVYYENKLIPLLITDEVLKEKSLAEKIKPYTEKIENLMDIVIGKTTKTITRSEDIEGAEQGLGNFLTDILRKTYNTDIAVYNKTGIRNDLLKGDITIRTFFEIEPFSNTVYIVNLKGSEVLDLLNFAFKNIYTFLNFSGMKIYYNPELDDVITKVIIGNEPLDINKTYSIAVPNFLAGGGDGHLTFKRTTDKYDTYDFVRDAYINYVKENKIIDYTFKQNLFNVLEE
jgi:5'-nucleotidase / UDP-sugar diphosphatase